MNKIFFFLSNEAVLGVAYPVERNRSARCRTRVGDEKFCRWRYCRPLEQQSCAMAQLWLPSGWS